MSPRLLLVLADCLLLVHFAIVSFVVLGLVLIWAGHFRKWEWVGNRWFRIAHLATIGVVAAEALGGVVCPLTTWENQLRLAAGGGGRYAGSFVQHWVHKAMFFELPSDVFTVCYVLFFVAVAASLWLVKPRWRKGPERGGKG